MVKKADVKRSLKWHKFWALFALVGLFSCGFVLGVFYGDSKDENGCEENREMYENLATAELELVNLLKGSADIKNYEMHQIIMEYEAAKLLEDKNDFLKNSL